MANPEVCPWCGAGKDGHDKDGNTRFNCLSWAGPHCVSNECQSDRCKERQIAQLKTKVEKLEKAVQIAVNTFKKMRNICDALGLEASDENIS